jgi:quinol monooxygenase YgiN
MIMLVIVVNVHVVEDGIEAFKAATLTNASASLLEPGVARFDVIQRCDNPAHFVLVEAYRNHRAPAAHKETPHYKVWRSLVEPLMASPRVSHRYDSLAPPDAGWETARGR